MAYIALKPCKFAGQAFKIGENVPAELIHPGAAKNLIKMQIISPADGGEVAIKPMAANYAPSAGINVTVHAEEGDMPLELTAEGLQQIFDVLTTNVEAAEDIINTMNDDNALILLHMSDARKGVKAAAEARAKVLVEALSEDEDEDEDEGEDDALAEPEESEGEQ